MDKPKIIGITGGSGSGKTHFVKQLAATLPHVSIHSMDNYYKDIEEQPLDKNNIENFDTLESIDLDKYTKDLKSLIDGNDLQLAEYGFNNTDAEAKIIEVKSAPVILAEGIFLLHLEKVRELLDLAVYVETPIHLMLKRRIIRDAEERGYDLQDVLYRYEYHVMPSFDKYTAPSSKWADMIIPNHDNFDKAVKVVSSFLTQ